MYTIFYILMISLFVMSNHPLMLIMITIMTALTNSLLALKIQNSYWLSIIIILGLVGGMMIIFLYFVSLVPNKKIFLSNCFFMLTLTMITLLTKPFILPNNNGNSKMISMGEFYSSNYFITIIILVLILIMLNYVSKIIFSPFVAMKSYFYE